MKKKLTSGKRVLVLDADMVPALTISRSLARRGCHVDTASSIEKPITGYSSCVTNTYQHPCTLNQEEQFIEWMANHTDLISYDLVIPVTERTLVPLSRQRDRFPHVRIAMPSPHSLELVLDKEKTVALARELEIPVPSGICISSVKELDANIDELSYPIVVKPSRSLGTNSRGSSQLKVSYAFDAGELLASCKHALLFGPVLLQEYFQGNGVGIDLIAQHGRIVYALQHLRLHEVPLSGGGSTLRKSVPVEPELAKAAQQLIAALEWNGVAMVEFKWNAATRAFSLMEINGRFWGSLPLAQAAGADFPSMLFDLEIDGEVSPCLPYQVDTYCRKLSSDIYWYESVLRGVEDTKIIDLPSNRRIFRELGLFLTRRHHFDVQSFSDPIPGLIDIRRIFSSYFGRFAELVSDRVFSWRQRRAWRRGIVGRNVADARSILIVCYGNINRSALAEALIKDSAESAGIVLTSAGFHQVDGRVADPVMIDVARQNGINLGDSRSTTITTELVKSSDIIFAMEKQHVDMLRNFDKECGTRTWLLGACEEASRLSPEISDPYGGAREMYENCYRRIAGAADRITSALKNTPER